MKSLGSWFYVFFFWVHIAVINGRVSLFPDRTIICGFSISSTSVLFLIFPSFHLWQIQLLFCSSLKLQLKSLILDLSSSLKSTLETVHFPLALFLILSWCKHLIVCPPWIFWCYFLFKKYCFPYILHLRQVSHFLTSLPCSLTKEPSLSQFPRSARACVQPRCKAWLWRQSVACYPDSGLAQTRCQGSFLGGGHIRESERVDLFSGRS